MTRPSIKELLRHEQTLFSKGFQTIAGIDEAGRGPLAGPVVAGCVIYSENNHTIDGIYDSKKISAKKREMLFEQIGKAYTYGVGIVDHQTIDRINIYEATKLAMFEAIKDASEKSANNYPDFILIDAMPLDMEIPHHALIKGDQKSYVIAAASIIAKVTRDRIMQKLHEQYPYYGWNHNMGYPTAEHRRAILEHGPSPYHRKSFHVSNPDKKYDYRDKIH